MDLREIYFEIRPEDIAYVKFIFESYEGVGILRTVERKRAQVVLLAIDDFLPIARSILTSLKNELPLTEIPKPAGLADDWLLRELKVEGLKSS